MLADAAGVVYMCRFSDGRAYIGKTVLTMAERRYGHYWDARHFSQSRFHRALATTLPGEHEWSVLAVGFADAERDALERFYIRAYRTQFPEGWNDTDGGDKGVACEDTRRRIAAKLRERELSWEHRWKISVALTGRDRGEDWRERMRGPDNPARRADVRAKLRELATGRTHSAETRGKIGAHFRGKAQSPEHIARRAAAIKKSWKRRKANGSTEK